MRPFVGRSLSVLLSIVILTSCASAQKVDPSTPQPVPSPSVKESLQKKAPPPKPRAYYHFLLSQLKLREGKLDEAIEELREAIAHDEKEPSLRVELASLYIYKGLMNEAIEECQAAVRVDPLHLTAHLLLGGVYSSL